MVQTKKLYKCKIFYETTQDGKSILEVKKELSNMFIMDNLSLKCFCGGLKTGDKYYNVVSIYANNQWLHPVRFIEYLFLEGIEAWKKHTRK